MQRRSEKTSGAFRFGVSLDAARTMAYTKRVTTQEFSTALRTEMNRCHLTNADLRRATDVSESSIDKLLSGRHLPSFRNFIALATVLPGLLAYVAQLTQSETALPRNNAASKETTTHDRRPHKRP